MGIGKLPRRRIGMALAAVALACLAAEGALRWRQSSRYGAVFSYYKFQPHPASGLEIPEPGFRAGPIAINSLGFRGPEIERPKPSGRLRLAFLGGSTTFCAEVSSFEATWPELVRARLAAALPERSIDAVNGGAGGYGTAQSLANLRVRVAPLQPDVIVIYHATNDLVQDTRMLAIAQGIYSPSSGRPSWLAERSIAWQLLEKNAARWWRARGADAASARLAWDPERLAREAFLPRARSLVSAAREIAPLVAVVTFASRLSPAQPPAERVHAAEGARAYMPFLDGDGILAGYRAYNEVWREVAGETEILLIEAEDRIPAGAAHFADTVHFTDRGARQLADIVAADLQPAVERLAAEAK